MRDKDLQRLLPCGPVVMNAETDAPLTINTVGELQACIRLLEQLSTAGKEKRRKHAIARALSAGIDYGVELCSLAQEEDSQWRGPMRKKAVRDHYGVEDWRTIEKHGIRIRLVTSKLDYVHVDDWSKTF
jgi:hypothetical protein